MLTSDAITVTAPWTANRAMKTSVGYVMQDLQPEDRSVTTTVVGQPQFSWKSKEAQIHNVLRTGSLFLPLPGPTVSDPSDIPYNTTVLQPNSTANYLPTGTIRPPDNILTKPLPIQRARYR